MLALVACALLVAAPAAAAAKKKPKRSTIVDQIPDLQAQTTPDAKKPGEPELAPDPDVEKSQIGPCLDAKGLPVAWKEQPSITDLAQATFDKHKRPIVEWNPGRFKFMRPVSKLFFFAHECAHHALGHLYIGVQGAEKEQQADCWAMHRLKNDGKLEGDDLSSIEQDLVKVARSDAHHSAGLMRASNLKWCLTSKMPEAPAKLDPPAKPSKPSAPQ